MFSASFQIWISIILRHFSYIVISVFSFRWFLFFFLFYLFSSPAVNFILILFTSPLSLSRFFILFSHWNASHFHELYSYKIFWIFLVSVLYCPCKNPPFVFHLWSHPGKLDLKNPHLNAFTYPDYGKCLTSFLAGKILFPDHYLTFALERQFRLPFCDSIVLHF